MSTFDAVMLSVFLKNIFSVSGPTANLVFFIVRAVNHQLVCTLVGSTAAFLSSTPPTLTRIVPPAASTGQINAADDSQRSSLA
ncbi:hypothetical protein IW262DRAFT_1461817 [Armillaria fumosa]|nr:hypothetical protein IW262DRAFT_1461817 [Armillaria fumosa]